MKKCISCSKKKIIIISCRCKSEICIKCLNSHNCIFDHKDLFKKNESKKVKDILEMNREKKVIKI